MNIINLEDKFEIANRGTVYTFKCPKWLADENPKILGEIFKFSFENREFYGKVKGVERFAIADQTLYENASCGWLIREFTFMEFAESDAKRNIKVLNSFIENGYRGSIKKLKKKRK